MSDEFNNIETDLLGQLVKMRDYLDSLQTQNNELIAQNDALKTQNEALLGQLSDAKTYQSDVMTQNKELMAQHKQITSSHNELTTQNKQLRESLKLSESQILKLTKQLSEVQDQPPAPSMTTHDEQELLDLIDKKNALIETLEQTVLKMRESLSMLNV